MPLDFQNANPGPRRDRSLVIACWVLGAAAVAELILGAVGLAPKLADNVRKSRDNPTQAIQQSTPSPLSSDQVIATPATTPHPGSSKHTVSKTTPPENRDDVPTTPSNGANSILETDRPQRQPRADAESPDGAVLEILSAKIESLGEGSKKLQIAIKKSRKQEAINGSQVKLNVYFYDNQNGEIVPSKAQVTSQWLSAPVDWTKPELLEVVYLSDGNDPDTTFAGYQVAVYYNGDLQDCRADPPKLKKLFEPKYYIPPDEQ
jgi:hypothetical protein